MKRLIGLSMAALAAGLLSMVACNGDDDGDGGDGNPPDAGQVGTPDVGAIPADAGAGGDASLVADAGGYPHTDNQSGVMHGVNKQEPLKYCYTCHGADLTGGVGKSCYTCHDADDHTVSRGGVRHRSGTESSCAACHGPNNVGGLGPACSDCH